MNHINLNAMAAQLPSAWQSVVVGRVGSGNVKVLRMDQAPYAEESHEYAEGLLVIEGQLNLTVAGTAISVGAGEIFVVPPRIPHAVAPGSTGTLVILDA